MHMLLLDTEQALMVVIAVEASNALLKARSHRADPEGLISASARLQDSKINQLKHQMALGPVAQWGDLTPPQKKAYQKLIEEAFESTDPLADAAIYEALKGFILAQRVAPANPIDFG